MWRSGGCLVHPQAGNKRAHDGQELFVWDMGGVVVVCVWVCYPSNYYVHCAVCRFLCVNVRVSRAMRFLLCMRGQMRLFNCDPVPKLDIIPRTHTHTNDTYANTNSHNTYQESVLSIEVVFGRGVACAGEDSLGHVRLDGDGAVDNERAVTVAEVARADGQSHTRAVFRREEGLCERGIRWSENKREGNESAGADVNTYSSRCVVKRRGDD